MLKNAPMFKKAAVAKLVRRAVSASGRYGLRRGCLLRAPRAMQGGRGAGGRGQGGAAGRGRVRKQPRLSTACAADRSDLTGILFAGARACCVIPREGKQHCGGGGCLSQPFGRWLDHARERCHTR